MVLQSKRGVDTEPTGIARPDLVALSRTPRMTSTASRSRGCTDHISTSLQLTGRLNLPGCSPFRQPEPASRLSPLLLVAFHKLCTPVRKLRFHKCTPHNSTLRRTRSPNLPGSVELAAGSRMRYMRWMHLHCQVCTPRTATSCAPRRKEGGANKLGTRRGRNGTAAVS
eukprot:3323433-Rhodomonas_salina.2